MHGGWVGTREFNFVGCEYVCVHQHGDHMGWGGMCARVRDATLRQVHVCTHTCLSGAVAVPREQVWMVVGAGGQQHSCFSSPSVWVLQRCTGRGVGCFRMRAVLRRRGGDDSKSFTEVGSVWGVLFL